MTDHAISGDADKRIRRITEDAQKRPLRSSRNVMACISNTEHWDGVFAYDTRSDQIVLLKAPPWEHYFSEHDYYEPSSRSASVTYPRMLTNTDIINVGAWLEEKFLQSFSKDNIVDGLDLVAKRIQFDPVAVYLDGLQWDGQSRLDSWLFEYGGAVEYGDSRDDFVRVAGAKWMISAVARAYKPGCKADHVLVLEGAQGLGKSSLFRALVPDQALFSDSVRDVGKKEASILIKGVWIAELSELAAVKRAEDVETIKAFITCQVDHYRAPYAKVAEMHPRRCVFGGSTNGFEYFRDDTGNRRFWPVKVDVEPDVVAIEDVRDQLWAEAAARYHFGDTWHITDRHVHEVATSEQEDRVESDPWEALILKYLESDDGRKVREVTTTDVLKNWLWIDTSQVSPQAATRVRRVLTSLGWTRTRLSREEAKAQGKVRGPWVFRRPDVNDLAWYEAFRAELARNA